MRRYEEGLTAYTYLADDDAVCGNGDVLATPGPGNLLLPSPPVDPAPLHDPVPPS